MQHVTLNRFYAGLLALLLLCVTLPAFAQSTPPPPADTASSQEPAVKEPSLEDLNEQLDQIRQKVTVKANDDLLSSLRQAALQVQKQADSLVARQAADIEKLDDQLNILGPVQPDEAQSLTSQRKTLTAQKNALVSDERQTNTLSQSARDLATQIFSLRRSLFDSQISTRTASPLSSAFWSTLIRPTDDDLGRLQGLLVDVRAVFDSVLSPENRTLFITVLIGALLIWIVVRRLLERLLIQGMVRWLPEGRLRRSALALAVGLSTILTITVATSLLRWGVISL